MILFNCFVIVSIFIYFSFSLVASYGFSKINGTFLDRERFSFSISFNKSDSDAFLLYAMDTNANRLLIKTAKDFQNSKKIIYNFNGKTFHDYATFNGYFYTMANLFLFKKKNLHVNYDTKIITDIYIGNPANKKSFYDYPVPQEDSKKSKRTFFWIGNIGPHSGLTKIDYRPLKVSSVFCINYFIIDFHDVKFETSNNYTSASCKINYKEVVHENGNYTNKLVNEKPFICSFYGMNTNAYCFKDLSTYGKQIHSYRIMKQDKNIKLMFAWNASLHNNYSIYSLLEIHSINSFILFSINQFNEIVLILKQSAWYSNHTIDILMKLDKEKFHIIFLSFEDQNLIIKISDGRTINIFRKEYNEYPRQINVGFSSNYNFSSTFQGKFAFRYDLSQLKPIKPKCKVKKVYPWSLILSIAIIICSLIIISIYSIRIKTISTNTTQNDYDIDISHSSIILDFQDGHCPVYERITDNNCSNHQ